MHYEFWLEHWGWELPQFIPVCGIVLDVCVV